MPSRAKENTLVLVMAFCVMSLCVIVFTAPANGKSADLEKSQAETKQANDGETFFSNPEKGDDWLPRYRKELKPGEKIRIYIQAGTPDLDQLRMIPSLKGKPRQDAVKAYEKWRQDTKPLNDEFNELRKKMPAVLIDRMLSKEEPQMDAKTKSEDFELLLKARAMLQKLRSNRLSVWQEVQAKLTALQLNELDELKSGKVPKELMTESQQDARNKDSDKSAR